MPLKVKQPAKKGRKSKINEAKKADFGVATKSGELLREPLKSIGKKFKAGVVGKAGKARKRKAEEPAKREGGGGGGEVEEVKSDKSVKDSPKKKTDEASKDAPPAPPEHSETQAPPAPPVPTEIIAKRETTIEDHVQETAEIVHEDRFSHESEFEIEFPEFDEEVSPESEDMEEQEEVVEQTINLDSINEKFPIGSDESEPEEDEFEGAMDYLEERKMKILEKNVFDMIANVPSIDQISIDTSIRRFNAMMAADRMSRVSEEEEQGEEEEQEQELDKEQKPVPEPEDGKIHIEEIFSSEISLEYDFSEEEGEEIQEQIVTEEKKGAEEILFEDIIGEDGKLIGLDLDDPNLLLARQAEDRQLQEDTAAFLAELIDCVVEVAEFVDPKKILREKLNKVELFEALRELQNDFVTEIKINSFVTRKIAEYYRRLKNNRPLENESLETYESDKNRYYEALDHLNCIMGREKSTTLRIEEKLLATEREENDTKIELQQSLTDLRSLIQKTYAKFGSDQLNMFVDRRLKEMSILRTQISEVRSVLISREHIMARLHEKKADLEYIAPDLYLSDYEYLAHDVFVLGEKIHEKNDELDRFRHQFDTDINILAHFREKEKISRSQLEVQRTVLEGLLDEQRALREIIHKLKKNRIRLKKEIQAKSNESGLIDKPALCIDYDETLEKCIEYREIVKNLQDHVENLQKKIIYYTKCERRSPSSKSRSRTVSV